MKLDYPATTRNREPLLQVLRSILPTQGTVLEIGSGSGQHAVYFAPALPQLVWQPSDLSEDALASIEAWRVAEQVGNVRTPVRLDLLEPWPVERADAVFCANVIHISPWPCTEALLRGSAGVLPSGAPLVLYGPFREGGQHTSASNEAFDQSLRSRDPEWGVRDLEEVTRLARDCGLTRSAQHAMPSNNQTIVFRRS